MFQKYLIAQIAALLVFSGAKAQLPGQRWYADRYSTFFANNTDTAVILDRIAGTHDWLTAYPDSAIAALTGSLEQSQQRNFVKGIGASLRLLLPLLDAQGRYPQKERLLRSVWTHCMNNPGCESLLPFIYNAFGKGFQQQEQYDKAAAYFTLAIYTARKYKPSELAGLYNNYGSLLSSLSMVTGTTDSQALYYLQEAATLAKKNRDYNVQATASINLGNIYLTRRDHVKSLQAFQEAQQLSGQYGLVQWQQLALLSIANLHYEEGQASEAVPFLQKAIALNKQNVDQYYQNAAIVTLGKVYRKLKDYGKAESLLLQSLKNAEQQGIGRDMIEGHQELADLYADRGLFQKAFAHHKMYVTLHDSLRAREIADNVNQLEIKYRTAEKDKTILEKQLHIGAQDRLIRQKNNYIRLTAAGCALLLLVLLALYTYYRQRRKIIAGTQKIEEMKAVMHGEERERIRIAQELHDGIGGMLSAINMNLNVAESAGFDNKENLRQIMQLVLETSSEVRKTAHNLMPAAMLRHNLPEAVRHYCDHLQSKGKFHVDVDIIGSFHHLPVSLNTTIFRIIQELLQNAAKHADASHVIVELESSHDRLTLLVEDNGKGFNVAEQVAGFGLENLKLRIKTLGGTLSIRSEEGSGTAILIKFVTDTGTQHHFMDAKE